MKRTKLGLRDFVKLGDFIQHIDTTAAQAVNRVAFSVAGIGSIKGALTIEASYQPVSGQRVAIAFQRSTLEPAQLQVRGHALVDSHGMHIEQAFCCQACITTAEAGYHSVKHALRCLNGE